MSGLWKHLATRMPLAASLRRMAGFGVLCAAAVVAILSVPVVSYALIEPLQIFPAITPSGLAAAAAGPPSAIVILSAGRRDYAPEFGEETVDQLSLERVRYAAFVARRTGLPVLVSGGATGGKVPLARLLADTLSKDYGIKARWLEDRSRDTAENAIDSAALLKRDGITHIILVTHSWHMRRARAAFAANGMDVTPAPTGFYRPPLNNIFSVLIPAMSALRMSGYAIHEIVGNVWYAARYGY